MTKNPIFKGVGTALITPFTETGVDYDAFGKLIDWQIDEGINALIIAGTTGEGSTLSDDEHKEVIRFAAERIAGRIPMIAGTGSNDTQYAIELSKFACDAGADALLVVTPYYNKATQNGLIRMYTQIADESSKPVIIYNVPSRTGVNVAPATLEKLCTHDNIIAVKEASGNISQVAKAAQVTSGRIDVYSGNDDQIVPIMSLGGLGVISVLSNIMPAKTVELCDRFLKGDVAGAAKIQLDLLPLIDALFCEVNPIPVKAACAAMGLCSNILRLPLTPMESEHEKVMLGYMKEQGLI